jgi:hypothetical protein
MDQAHAVGVGEVAQKATRLFSYRIGHTRSTHLSTQLEEQLTGVHDGADAFIWSGHGAAGLRFFR